MRAEATYKRTSEAADELHAALLRAHALYDVPADDEQSEWLHTLAREAAADLGLTAFWMAKDPQTGERVGEPTAAKEVPVGKAETLRLNVMRQFRSRWHHDPSHPVRR